MSRNWSAIWLSTATTATKTRRSRNAQGVRSLPRSVRRVGGESGQEWERDLEDRCRTDVEHRNGRAITGGHGSAHRKEQHGQRSRPAGERTACPNSAFIDADHVLLQVKESSRPLRTVGGQLSVDPGRRLPPGGTGGQGLAWGAMSFVSGWWRC